MIGYKKRYVFNSSTMNYELRDVPVREVVHSVGKTLLLGLGAFVFYFWLYAGVFGLKTPKKFFLERKSQELHSSLSLLQKRIDCAEESLEDLQNKDEVLYRSIFGMDLIPEDVRSAGYGGVDRYDYLKTVDRTGVLVSVMQNANVASKRAYIQSKSFEEISAVVDRQGEMALSIPSICPVYRENVRFTSSYGVRVDPVSQSFTRMHSGIDFAGTKGEPIFATGNGVVVKAERSGNGYGSVIEVNHGFGYVTRYAHLNSFDVKPGQRILRGEKIGELGNSGRSTGPHLHYEVLFRGRNVNPLAYYDDISSEDYSTLVSVAK